MSICKRFSLGITLLAVVGYFISVAIISNNVVAQVEKRDTQDKFNPTYVAPSVTAHDSFGRLRVSTIETLFDSKQLFDSLPLSWDDAEVSGSGTSSTYNTNQASTTLSTSNVTAGKRVRQTFMWFNYQPGKGHLVYMTGILGEPDTGTIREIGYFNDDNGLFFESDETDVAVVIRTNTSGTPVNREFGQADWNLDTLDGFGPSRIDLNFDFDQIFVIDFQWLGTGAIRYGFIIDGDIIYAHEVDNANALSLVYMSNPNLPLRYTIENDGTGAVQSLTHICSSVMSEGGRNRVGMTRYASTNGVHVDANIADTIYAVVGIRLQSDKVAATVKLLSFSILSEGNNDDFEWFLIANPSIEDVFTYSDETNSAVQIARGNALNVVTDGIILQGGYANRDSQNLFASFETAGHMGSSIDGTVDTCVLCVRPLTNNANIQGSITWRESF